MREDRQATPMQHEPGNHRSELLRRHGELATAARMRPDRLVVHAPDLHAEGAAGLLAEYARPAHVWPHRSRRGRGSSLISLMDCSHGLLCGRARGCFAVEEPVVGRGRPRFSRSVVPSYSRAEDATPLQLRNDFVDEIVEPPGQVGKLDGEAVGRLGRQPFFHLVGDGLRRADHGEPGIAAEPLRQLAHGEVLALAPARWRARRPLLAGVALRDVVRQRPVRIELRGVVAERDRQRADGVGVVAPGCRGWRALSRASSTVSPTTTKQPGSITMWSRFRPSFPVRALTSA